MEFYCLQTGINLNHYGSTSVGAELPLTSSSTNDLLIDNVSAAPPSEYTPNTESLDPQKPDLPCTPDLTLILVEVVGVESSVGESI